MEMENKKFGIVMTKQKAIEIIIHEYFNYEIHLAFDDTDLMAALKHYIKQYPTVFTVELIAEVKKKCWAKAVDENLF